MAKTVHVSETPATQWLRKRGIAFGEHPYDYVEHGGTARARASWAWTSTRWSRRS
jgi:hypothetical protein